jgi:mono/diheme cytochrome c family protein
MFVGFPPRAVTVTDQQMPATNIERSALGLCEPCFLSWNVAGRFLTVANSSRLWVEPQLGAEFEMGTHNRPVIVLFVSFIGILAATANDKEPAGRGNADAGRELALEACTGCHVVSDDQRFSPLLKGAPSFREIANRPNVTAASLRRTIAALPQVPRNGRMANPLLTDHQLVDVAAYIMTWRENRTKEP